MTDSAPSENTTGSAIPLVIAPRELALLTQGFAFLFWGIFALVGVTIESLIAGRPRTFVAILGLVGALATGLAGRRLRQTGNLAPHWQRATGCLMVTGWLTAYLTPLAGLWLMVPTKFYLFCNALAWVGVFLCHLVAANHCVFVLGRALPSPALTWQGLLYGAAVVLMLLVPFVVVAVVMVQTALTGVDPLNQLRYWLVELRLSSLLLFAWLTPLSLTMSLIWTAQDVAWERLTAPPADNNLTALRS